MTKDLITRDPGFGRIQEATQVKIFGSAIDFPNTVSPMSGLAETYVVSHYDGEGASTLALLLAQFISPSPLIIEVGTNKSRAYKSVGKEDIFRPDQDADRPVYQAMDERLRNPSRTAIIEFGRGLWREAIAVSRTLQAPNLDGKVYYCFLASDQDLELKTVNLARKEGIKDLIVFGMPKLAREKREGFIKIPTLPREIQSLVYRDGFSMLDAISTTRDRYSLTQFGSELERFAMQVGEALAHD